jgi:adenylate kinase family enzyme
MVENKVAFSGKMCSGKTTMAELLVERYNFNRLAIGDQIKAVSNLFVENMVGLEEYIEKWLPEHKERIIKGFKEYKKQTEGAIFVKQGKVYLKNEAYRGLTQKTGDIVRGEYGDDVWINLLMKQADEIVKNGGKVVCDDVRLLVEKENFEDTGYKMIRLNINEEDQKKRILKTYKTYNEEALKHKTETELDQAVFEFSIDATENDIEQVFQKVQNYLS